MEASITFKSVAKKINQDTLLADLSFGVEKGTRFGIVGPNGSGKSTIVKLISGIFQKDKGSIFISGNDINIKSDEIKYKIGYMPQISEFDNDLSIIDNLLFYGQLFGLSKENTLIRIKDLAKKLDFSSYLFSYPSNVSYGIKRIIMFARSIVHNPDVLLLDEPTTNVDPINRELIWNFVLNNLEEKTVLFTTSNFSDAQEYSQRIAILYDGNIKYNGTFEYLVENTHGLSMFSIVFKNKISEELVKNISLNPKIIKPTVSDNVLKFYSTDKQEYFKILKFSLDTDINDIDISKCSLSDIFKGINLKREVDE